MSRNIKVGDLIVVTGFKNEEHPMQMDRLGAVAIVDSFTPEGKVELKSSGTRLWRYPFNPDNLKVLFTAEEVEERMKAR